jgi:hypothetical protein
MDAALLPAALPLRDNRSVIPARGATALVVLRTAILLRRRALGGVRA